MAITVEEILHGGDGRRDHAPAEGVAQWTPENDMLTAAMKLKRPQIVKAFKNNIDAISVSFHKLYSPKGIGMIIINNEGNVFDLKYSTILIFMNITQMPFAHKNMRFCVIFRKHFFKFAVFLKYNWLDYSNLHYDR